MSTLEISDVCLTYPGGVGVLHDVTLSLHAGLCGLLGPNGAGKSSLMRILGSVQRPDSGAVRLAGRDAFRDPLAWRRELGYLPQDFGVYPGIDAASMLLHLARLKGLTKQGGRQDEVDHLLHRVNLWDVRHRAVSEYSGGMRQRFGVAQALLGHPRLILLDEPCAGLDPHERNGLMDLLAESSRDAVVILSTHIVQDVEDICDTAAILHRGRIVRHGGPRALCEPLEGRVWHADFAVGQRPGHEVRRRSVQLISERTVRGRRSLRALSATPLPAPFRSTPAMLEDAYFTALHAK